MSIMDCVLTAVQLLKRETGLDLDAILRRWEVSASKLPNA